MTYAAFVRTGHQAETESLLSEYSVHLNDVQECADVVQLGTEIPGAHDRRDFSFMRQHTMRGWNRGVDGRSRRFSLPVFY